MYEPVFIVARCGASRSRNANALVPWLRHFVVARSHHHVALASTFLARYHLLDTFFVLALLRDLRAPASTLLLRALFAVCPRARALTA